MNAQIRPRRNTLQEEIDSKWLRIMDDESSDSDPFNELSFTPEQVMKDTPRKVEDKPKTFKRIRRASIDLVTGRSKTF